MTDVATPVFLSAIRRLTSKETEAFRKGRGLGLDGKPAVTLATYDNTGTLHEVGTFDLEGDGSSESRKKANATLQASCLMDAAGRVSTERTSANLLRSLAGASELALGRGDRGAALLAFGLGRSVVEGIAIDQMDLASADARQNVIRELQRVGILAAPGPVAVTFVDPDEGMASGITAGFVNTFVEDELCAAVTTATCRRVEVLP